MNIKFTAPDFELCKIEGFDVITTSVMNSNEKLDGGNYGDVIGLDDYGL